jgi:hypothetical protein
VAKKSRGGRAEFFLVIGASINGVEGSSSGDCNPWML